MDATDLVCRVILLLQYGAFVLLIVALEITAGSLAAAYKPQVGYKTRFDCVLRHFESAVEIEQIMDAVPFGTIVTPWWLTRDSFGFFRFHCMSLLHFQFDQLPSGLIKFGLI